MSWRRMPQVRRRAKAPRPGAGQAGGGGGPLPSPEAAQLASAASARAVISSTVPVPLIWRYLGAAAGSALGTLAWRINGWQGACALGLALALLACLGTFRMRKTHGLVARLA